MNVTYKQHAVKQAHARERRSKGADTMRRFANFIVERRYFVLVLMLAVTAVCGLMIPQVEINGDMTKYLSERSPMKQGLDIMEEEFQEGDSLQAIHVMFRDLPAGQRETVARDLSRLPYVADVAYDRDSEDYNRDGCTLYELTTEYDYDSDEEIAIEKAITETYAQYDVVIETDDADSSDSVTPALLLTALSLLMVILFIMCASWFEPIIFLVTIGIAVVINMGTNLIMGSVSTITFSIAAILQLVLSMDYSIILMNRYRQEVRCTADRRQAMKNALVNAFSTITSSAFTTFVGLLMLVFMSFKIGRDLGIVLAKGVLCSLLSIFTVLPGLILMSDKLIAKTAKREPKIPMKGVAAVSYRFRRPLALLFLVLMVGSYFLQGLTPISFSTEANSEIYQVFPKENSLVVLYNNQDSDSIQALAEKFEDDPSITALVSYPTTMGKNCTAGELVDLIETIAPAEDLDLDEETLRILYYHYFRDGQAPKLTMSQLLNFLADDVAENETFAEQLDPEMLDQIDVMKNLADANSLTQPMTAAAMTKYLGQDGLDLSTMKQLYLLYFTQNGGADTSTMPLPAFTSFVIHEVAEDPEYASMFDKNTLSQLRTLETYTDVAAVTRARSYQDMASALGMDPEQVKLLYVYAAAQADSYEPAAMTLQAFAAFMNGDVAANPAFASQFDQETLAQMKMLAVFTNPDTIQRQMTAQELAGAFGIAPAMAEQLLCLYYGSDSAQTGTITLPAFTNFLVNQILPNEAYAGAFDSQTKQQLTGMNRILTAAASGQAYPPAQLAALTGLDTETVTQLFTLYYGTMDLADKAMSLPTFTDFLVSTVLPSEAYGGMFDEETRAQLIQLHQLVMTAVSGQSFSPAEMAGMLGMDEAQVLQLYTLYFGAQVENKTMSPQQMTEFILSNEAFSAQLGEDTVQQVTFLKGLMEATQTGMSYSYRQMAQLLGMDEAQMKMLYTYHDFPASAGSFRMSIQEVLNFLAGNSGTFSAMMDTKTLGQLELARSIVNGSVAGTAYVPQQLAQLLGMDASRMKSLYLLYISRHGDTSGWKLSLKTLVDFMVSDVLTNPDWADAVNAEMAKNLTGMQTLIHAVLSGQRYSAQELASLLSAFSETVEANEMELLCLFYGSKYAYSPAWAMSMETLFNHLSEDVVNDARFEEFLDDSFRSQIDDTCQQLDDGIAQLKGTNHSILMLSTTLPAESEETTAFLDELTQACGTNLKNDYYLVGTSAMYWEMKNDFSQEMLFITLLTAISIYLIVALTFRSFLIPAFLVLIVLCGVYLTVAVSGLRGESIIYLAYIVVQCILMGATIDYGILYTNCYREFRQTLDIRASLAAAYQNSTHTILTSGLIIVIVTGILGTFSTDPSVAPICLTISMGALSAILLILFVLPGMLATFDRFVVKRRRSDRPPGD